MGIWSSPLSLCRQPVPSLWGIRSVARRPPGSAEICRFRKHILVFLVLREGVPVCHRIYVRADEEGHFQRPGGLHGATWRFGGGRPGPRGWESEPLAWVCVYGQHVDKQILCENFTLVLIFLIAFTPYICEQVSIFSTTCFRKTYNCILKCFVALCCGLKWNFGQLTTFSFWQNWQQT